jgi:DHA1 family multidrug resistance protein-like MFS transporter
MKDIIRDSTLGQIVRFVTRNKVLQYPEDASEFAIPEYYLTGPSVEKRNNIESLSNESSNADVDSMRIGETVDSSPTLMAQNVDVERNAAEPDLLRARTQTEIQAEQLQVDRTVSRPIIPVKTVDGDILVDWYTTGIYLFISNNSDTDSHIDTSP